MRVMVTGSSGFIGSWLVDALNKEEGVTTFGLDLGAKAPVLANLAPPNYYRQCSVLDYGNLDYLFDNIRPHIVYHLAAKLGVQDVMDQPGQTVSENVIGTLNVTNLAEFYGAHVIFASTSDVYGQSKDMPFKESGSCVIGPSVEPRWSYAISKLAGEHTTLAKGGTVVRFFNVTGPGQSTKYVVPIMVKQAVRGEDITVMGDGSSTRCFGDVRDIVRALVGLLDTSPEEISGEIFNIGSDSMEISMNQLAKLIQWVVNPKAGIAHIPYTTNYTEMPQRRPDLTKIQELLGWAPKIPLKQTLLDIAG